MRIVAIDSGLANTAVVAMTETAIIRTWMFKTAAGDGRKVDFAHAVERAESIAAGIEGIRDQLGSCTVVAEGYKDIPGALRKAANRWTTPLAIGLIIPALRSLSEDGVIVWQDPEMVMKAHRELMVLWAKAARAKTDAVLTNDQLLTNEHLRSAAAHGLYYAMTHKEG